jgi:dTDP-glucose 4,6-dehydratase
VTHEHEYIMALLDKERPQCIVNYAAQGEGAASFGPDNWRYYETNCVGLVRLVGQLTTRGWLERFVHIGTSELYGSVTEPSKETDPIIPSSPYAASKAAFDLHLQCIGKVQKFPFNIIRPSNCYTPGQQLHRIVPKAILCAVAGRELQLHGGGWAQKSYMHGDDLSAAVELVSQKAPIGEVYNAGPDTPMKIRDLVSHCVEAARSYTYDAIVKVVDDRPGQDAIYWLDSTKLLALGWEQSTSLYAGLADMARWGKTHYTALEPLPTDFKMRA